MKAVFFDFDGTLVDSIGAIIESYRIAFETHRIPYPGDDEIGGLIGVGLDVIIGRFVSGQAVAAVTETYRSHYLQLQRSGRVRLFPGYKDHLNTLQHAGFDLGIVTSKLHSFTVEFLQEHALSDSFAIITAAEDVTHKKPHPEPLLTAASACGLLPTECLYIGDTVHDGQAARAAEMPFAGVLTGTGTEQELAKFGLVYQNLSELTARFV